MKLNRIISALTAAALCLPAPCFSPLYSNVNAAVSYTDYTYNNISFALYSDHAEVRKCDTSVTSAEIPETIEGLPVTVIGSSAFMSCTALKTLSLPDSITAIGDYAFWNCRSLELSSLPSSLKSIGNSAFYYCDGITSLTIPDGISVIDEGVFYSCHNLKTLVCEGDITEIGFEAFSYCRSLSKLSVGNSLKTIKSYAFRDCTRLTSFSLPDSIESVEPHAFENCSLQVDLSEKISSGLDQNIIPSDYSNTADNVKSYIVENSSGFEFIAANDNKYITVEQHSADGELASSKRLDFELPLFGGVYCGAKYNFIIFGTTNYQEKESDEVYRVVKYSKQWDKLDYCSVSGADTILPFDGGSLRCSEYNDTLFVHTSRLMYTTEDGFNHQSSFTFSVNEDKMTSNINQNVYSSHSFDQYVMSDKDGTFYADLGDAFPRSVVVQTQDGQQYDALTILGSAGDNTTGVSLGGFELTDNSCVIAGNSINQTGEFDPSGKRNIFVYFVDKSLRSKSGVWLTDYHKDSDSKRVLTPKLVKSSNSSTLYVLWEEYDESSRQRTTKAAKLSADGTFDKNNIKTLSDTPLSDCQPVFTDDGCIAWFNVEKDGGSSKLIKLNAEETFNNSGTVTTAASTSSSLQKTTTTATTTSAVTTTTAETPDLDSVVYNFSGLDTAEDETLYFEISQSTGYIHSAKIYYTNSDGVSDAMIYSSIFSNFLDAPGSRVIEFTAPCYVDSLDLCLEFSGSLPDADVSFTEIVTATASTSSTTTTTTAVVPGFLPGDANCDGFVRIGDAVAVLQHIANIDKYELSPQGYINGDVDGIKGISPRDALEIIFMAL